MTVTASDGAPILPRSNTPSYEKNDPRSVVLLNGTAYIPVRWTASLNGHGATDEATVTLPLSTSGDMSVQLFRGTFGQALAGIKNPTPQQIAAATDNSPVFVEIWAGFPANLAPGSKDQTGMTRVFLGVVDIYNATVKGNEVTFNCRSLAAPLVDNKLTSAPLGMTSVQFAAAMAKSVGLNVVTKLSPKWAPVTLQEALAREFVGGAGFNSAVFNLKPWDLLLKCSVFDDADVWVDGDTLYYMSVSEIDKIRNTITLEFGKDFFDEPVLTHAPQFNKNIRVEVRTSQARTSHVRRVESNPNGGITVTSSSKVVTSNPVFGTSQVVSTSYAPDGSTSTSTREVSGGSFNSSTGPGSESGKEIYKFFIPNISDARANQIAQAMWRQISQHEYSLTFSMPVTKAMLAQFKITSLLVFTGLPYQYFNTKYWPRKIQLDFDIKSGFRYPSVACLSHLLPQGAV